MLLCSCSVMLIYMNYYTNCLSYLCAGYSCMSWWCWVGGSRSPSDLFGMQRGTNTKTCPSPMYISGTHCILHSLICNQLTHTTNLCFTIQISLDSPKTDMSNRGRKLLARFLPKLDYVGMSFILQLTCTVHSMGEVKNKQYEQLSDLWQNGTYIMDRGFCFMAPVWWWSKGGSIGADILDRSSFQGYRNIYHE